MLTLPDSFLPRLVSQLDNENTIGITMAGSIARGEGDRYSDVDIQHYVRVLPGTKVEANTLRLIDGLLVSVHANTIEDETAGLGDPHRAIWVVPGLRQAQILLDKDGSVTRLVEAARLFRWQELQPAVEAMISWQLCGLAEEVTKILGALETKNESKTLYAITSLHFDIVETLLIWRGVLVPTENAYFALAQEAAGWESEWTRQLRLAAAIDPIPEGLPVYAARGAAVLRLYRISVEMMAELLRPQDDVVVKHALALMAEAGY